MNPQKIGHWGMTAWNLSFNLIPILDFLYIRILIQKVY